jgi:hypothetical protein
MEKYFSHIKDLDMSLLDKMVFVTGATSNYYNLLTELLASIKATKHFNNIKVCVLDAGLTEDQKKELSKNVYSIKSLDANLLINNSSILLHKSCLDLYFEDFQYYFWLDADTWIQDEHAIIDYLIHAQKYGIGISKLRNHENFLANYWKDIPSKYISECSSKPYFNAGVFCIDNFNKNIFQNYRDGIIELHQTKGHFYHIMDEFSLNYAIYSNNLIYDNEFLSENYNYLTTDAMGAYSLPAIKDNIYYNPYNKQIIGIIHLIGETKYNYEYATTILNENFNVNEHHVLCNLKSYNPNIENNPTNYSKVSLHYNPTCDEDN